MKWCPVIIDSLLNGAKRFNELKMAMPDISSKVLVDNLTNLEKEGILKRKVNTVSPISATYHLTEKGQDLEDISKAI
jgi:DNA-binding HxlR family transcriptional regulator|tara:strand:+ start:447 stop:677 length:231 start_codon:yes stop_codon:yes gene_type:complete